MNLSNFIDSQTGLIFGSDGGRDNMPVCTAIALILGSEVPTSDFLNLAFTTFLARQDVWIGYGIFRRYPGATDNSVDNMIGACAISSDYAKVVYKFSRQTEWCFNVGIPLKFDFQDWYGRFVGFAPFVKACAGETLDFIDIALISSSCLYSLIGPRNETSNRILEWIMVDKMKGKSNFLDATFGLWRHVMNDKYPGGPAEMLAIYYGATHPFAVTASTKF